VQWGGRGSGDAFDTVVSAEFEPALARLKADAVQHAWLRPRAVYGYFPAQADTGTVSLYRPMRADDRSATRERMAHFAFPRQQGHDHLCLADYFKSSRTGIDDVAALQVVTVGPEAGARFQALQARGEYTEALYVHGLAVAAAEATAEWMHRRIRRELGLPDGQGKRYSWGYPACPDLSQHGEVFEVLHARAALGLDLTTAFQIVPEHSTAALVVHHPEATYFSVRRVLETGLPTL
jgi:5-methyltetrahydrofolate--homocysteine methyltransferase